MLTTGNLIKRVQKIYRRFLARETGARTVVLGVTDEIADALTGSESVRLESLGTLAVIEKTRPARIFG